MSNVALEKIIRKNIAKNIQGQRKISLRELAQQADIALSTLEKLVYEQKQDVEVSTLLRISKALGITLDQLVK